MPWGFVATGVALIASDRAASKAAKGAEKGAQISADAAGESLEYLKGVEALPSAFREAALTEQGARVGLTLEEGNVISSGGDPIERARRNPLYEAIMGSRQAGEESILRTSSATGGLRSGGVQANLYDYNVQLENKALLSAYQDDQSLLAGLAGLPSYASEIAGIQTGIGVTQGQGVIAAAQAKQQGYQNIGENITGGVKNYLYAKQQGLI